jgi:hypothetical protein
LIAKGGTYVMLNGPSPLDSVVHIIQVALTPVFLLSGIGTLLNVFSTRLGRVSDRVDQLALTMDEAGEHRAHLQTQLTYLRMRSMVLDIAAVMGSLAGAATCAATLVLFVGVLSAANSATALYILFGSAVIFTLGALTAFLVEMLMTSTGLRAKVRRVAQSEDADGDGELDKTGSDSSSSD